MAVIVKGASVAPAGERTPTIPVSQPAHRAGRLQLWRARWFGERDLVADQLADIARQGASMARLAHVCASLMLVLFSAGSLVALGGDALLSVVDGAQHGQLELPAAISLGVSTLLVLCMDVGMLCAASSLRLLATRRAEPHAMRLHRGVMVTVTLLEAGTYAYMAWRYETPVSLVAWGLILARALAAPLLTVYLAMARPLPVTARDILAQVELASGLGVIRDVVTKANDPAASLEQKVALFGASAVMTPEDGARLDGLLAVLGRQRDEAQRLVEAAHGAPSIDEREWPVTGVAPDLDQRVEEALRPFAAVTP
jgi:hypothetical protein